MHHNQLYVSTMWHLSLVGMKKSCVTCSIRAAKTSCRQQSSVSRNVSPVKELNVRSPSLSSHSSPYTNSSCGNHGCAHQHAEAETPPVTMATPIGLPVSCGRMKGKQQKHRHVYWNISCWQLYGKVGLNTFLCFILFIYGFIVKGISKV